MRPQPIALSNTQIQSDLACCEVASFNSSRPLSYHSTNSFNQGRARANNIKMTSSTKIYLRPEDVGIMSYGKQSQETAEKTSELLQRNHENHHIFFNAAGFHNHIVHHLLTLYGVGAPFSVIQKQYDHNASYQRPQQPLEERIVEDMSDPEKFKGFLGNEKYYQDFLVFFQKQIEEDEEGWEGVLKKFLWSGDERGEDLLVRMFASFLHPIIHLGFGIEFNQPAIIAEALAQAAVHENWIGDFYFGAEKAAAQNSSSSPSPTVVELLKEIRADEKLRTAAHWEDENKIRDGLMARAPEETLKYASKWSINKKGGKEELEKRTVEMIQAAVYFTAGAQRPSKQVKFDFFYLHCVTSSIFWPTFNNLPFLTLPQKFRLLEWKVRTDLITYASRGSPEILPQEITTYIPKIHRKNTWKNIFERVFAMDEDSHVVKLLRAVKFGKEVSAKYEKDRGDGDWQVVKEDMWEKVGNMVIDSVEGTGATWVRGAGFEEAWRDFGVREERVSSVDIGSLRL